MNVAETLDQQNQLADLLFKLEFAQQAGVLQAHVIYHVAATLRMAESLLTQGMSANILFDEARRLLDDYA